MLIVYEHQTYIVQGRMVEENMSAGRGGVFLIKQMSIDKVFTLNKNN